VGIAQALVHDPDVLILDEPTDGLDPNQKYEMRSLIRGIAPKKAIVISTHILEEVEAVCSRAIIIANGRLLADETPAVLLAKAPGAGSVAVTIAVTDSNRAVEVIAKEPGVLGVAIAERVNGVARLLVQTSSSRPSASALAGALGRADIKADEIYLEQPTLDDVFRQITSTTTKH
jgi:ABC-2 type transport system ATP-binding protein